MSVNDRIMMKPLLYYSKLYRKVHIYSVGAISESRPVCSRESEFPPTTQ